MLKKERRNVITPDEYFDFMDEYGRYRRLAASPEQLRNKIIEVRADE